MSCLPCERCNHDMQDEACVYDEDMYSMAKLPSKVKTKTTLVSSPSKKTRSLSSKGQITGSVRSQKKLPRRKVSCPFSPGDFVTGKDRSYRRSIYKMLSTTENPELGLFEFQSLDKDVVERWKDRGAHVNQYQMVRLYNEYRHATKKELKASDDARMNYFLLRLLCKLGIET